MQKRLMTTFILIFLLLAIPFAYAECTDTEGAANVADVYTMGTATDSGGDKIDSCDGNKLTEFYCDMHGVVVAKIPYECPYGCKNGACIKGEILCTDSDEKDMYTKGTVKGLASIDVTNTWTDYCETSGDEKGRLAEFYCDGDYGKKTYITCMHGECKDGACTSAETVTNECSVDSDCGIIQKCGETWQCVEGTCRQLMAECPTDVIKPTDETGPVEIPEGKECSGCILEDKCYPIGYRKSGQYCSDNNSFIIQLKSSSACENSFECESNVCAGSECIGMNLIQKILAFFKNLFGSE